MNPEPAITTRPQPLKAVMRPIAHLRWWIGAVLLGSTIINYIDRQTLSLLAPYLKLEYHWTNTDYANIVIGVLNVAMTVVAIRLVDRVGRKPMLIAGVSGMIVSLLVLGLSLTLLAEPKSPSDPAGRLTSSLWTTPKVAIASVWASRYRHRAARREGSAATATSSIPRTDSSAPARSRRPRTRSRQIHP